MLSRNYHDCVLISIRLDAGSGSVDLTFKSEPGERMEIILRGCSLFKSSDLVLQNVVSRIITYTGHDVIERDVADKLEWVSSLSDASSFLNAERMGAIVSSIKNGCETLIYVEPSWGAQIVALCKEIVER